MLRKVVIASLLAAFLAAAPATAQKQLLPDLTYDRLVQFTPHGPVVLNVLTGPRPGGLWSFAPVLSNETMLDTERLTAMEQRLSPTATVAGVNGDLFDAKTGIPRGLLMRGGGLDHPPLRSRSSVGVDSAGDLVVARVQLIATWQGSGQRRAITELNERPESNGVALFTPAWGSTTPPLTGSSTAVVLSPFPAVTPNTPVAGPAVQSVPNAAVPVPQSGAVLVARGTAAVKLAQEAPVGQTVTVRPVLKPDWSGVVSALGGGPVLVRNGRGVFRADEAFTSEQLLLRAPRAAVGQLQDGRIVLVAVDGGRPGYSTGMTNFELAQALVRVGAVTAMALGAGGSTAMAFDGRLLSTPSGEGGEEPVADALLFSYAGVYAPQPLEPVLSPNGDGVAEKQQLSYKVVRPSTVSVNLVGPDGVPRYSFAGPVQPGTYPLDFTGLKPDGTPELEGTYRWTVTATDDLGRASSIERPFSLNDTLGFARPVGTPLGVPRQAARTVASFTLAHPAAVTARIETFAGVVLRMLDEGQADAGPLDVGWNGLTDSGAVVFSGRYVVRVIATNELGTAELTAPFLVRRVAGGG